MTPFALGPQWPTKDPFLFVAHHVDHYPTGNPDLGPDDDLEGRPIGSDFASIDGWNMYHGSQVPGFPQHPHRGFETVTYLRSGVVDHSDSLGATARYGSGDVQWLTAGAGIVHSEMFPLLSQTSDNPLELFQIWVNLPRASKMAEPHFSMFWGENTPKITFDGRSKSPVDMDPDGQPLSELSILAGEVDGRRSQPPPPDSWASAPQSDLAILHLELRAGHRWQLPELTPGVDRTIYFYRGQRLDVGTPDHHQTLESGFGLEVVDTVTELRAVDGDALVMILQARPIGEPVAQYGPFVMNDREGLEQAFLDYRSTEFGGWPWDRDDPVHPVDAGRFALRPDGGRETPEAVGSIG